VEDIFLQYGAAIVHLHIDEVGIDAVDGGAEGFEEHGDEVAASVAEDREQGTGNREQGTEGLRIQ
jgi:hypothetical protein